MLAEASKPEIVRNFLGNCAVKLFLRNTDGETNELASKEVFGEYSAVVVNLSESGSGRGGSGGFAQSGSMGEQLQRQRRVPPERFAALAVPDRATAPITLRLCSTSALVAKSWASASGSRSTHWTARIAMVKKVLLLCLLLVGLSLLTDTLGNIERSAGLHFSWMKPTGR